MKIKRSILSDALKAVQPGLATKEMINQSASFVFTEGRVFTYNDEVAVSMPLAVDFEGAVSAKEFQALINKFKTEEISIELNKGELLVTGGKSKAGLRLETNITLPLEELGMPEEWIELPEKFCKAVQFCLFSASKDANKAVLMNIHVFDQFVESCDNYRVTQYDMGKDAEGVFDEELLIPASAAKDIIVNKPVEYAITDGWLHFRNEDDITFSCRYFEAEYPDFSVFLECVGTNIEFPATLPDILDRADVLSDGERVTIILEGNDLIVTTENDAGWFEEGIDTKYKGKPVEFDIQPDFMKSIMKFNGTAVIGERALRFDSENFVHVVKLLMPKAKK